MLSALILIASLQPSPAPAKMQAGIHPQIIVGWGDELGVPKRWHDLLIENNPKVTTPGTGLLQMNLGHVPDNWPYQYQWSGIAQDMQIDVARYPVLIARVTQVQGYAHLDIDVLDATGKATKTLRSTTLTNAGLSTIDLSKQLDPAIYHFQVRLIVGGPNEGCSATYDWVRFFRPADAEYITKNPDFPDVRTLCRILR